MRGTSETRDSGPATNSLQWWETYFQESWDAHNGRQQTRYFMECLLANLPDPELRFLRNAHPTILDWGCALGDGVDVLATSFPKSDVAGLDFSRIAIEEAARTYPQHRFIHAEEGAIPVAFDVITNSNCLEHFEFPIAVLQSQLLACRSLYVILTPYNESPLSDYHRAQFREESFPERLNGFVRLHCKRIGVDQRFWPGQQLLVVYASQSYLQGTRRTTTMSAGQLSGNEQSPELSEKEKWDAYYADLPDVEEDSDTRRFNLEFVQAVSDLLPLGGRTLEAGCGAGWQSLALARTKRFQASLLDFSPHSLAYASRLFAREGVETQLIEADLAKPGPAEYDLVFSAGVLEHYSVEDQIALVRAMKSRAKRYVLVLVPNRRCYWYWLWRFHRSVHNAWKWGKEVPVDSLAHVMHAAGLEVVGDRYFGAAWAESFISEFFPQSPSLRDELLEIHRSLVIPNDQKAYLVGSLGAVDRERTVVPGWFVPATPPPENAALLAAALADALAVRNTATSDAGAQPVSMAAQNGLTETVARLTASNAELIESHRLAVEAARVEIAKRDETVAHYQRQETELTASVARLTRTNTDLVEHHYRSIENANEQLLVKDELIEDLDRNESTVLQWQREFTAIGAEKAAAYQKSLDTLSAEIAARDAAIRHYQQQEAGLAKTQEELARANASLLEQHREAVERGVAEALKRDEVIEHYRRREQELLSALGDARPEKKLKSLLSPKDRR
jgi:2-polyprenyl-3-methyl-5-hydroxy-6-metoxy-1,4-benzoquinol methylase